MDGVPNALSTIVVVAEKVLKGSEFTNEAKR